jgi:hypothetical protein
VRLHCRLVRIWSPQGVPLGTLRQSQKISFSNATAIAATATAAAVSTTTAAATAATAAATGTGAAAAGITSEQHLANSTLHNSSVTDGSVSPRAHAKSTGISSVRSSSSADVSSDVITPWLFRPDRSELRASRAVAAAAVMKQLAITESAAKAATGSTATATITGTATKVTC